ncbi:MAG: hypothetical protein Q4B52_03775 [Tissierellia bacterium]|nr:hypothetical protein [Tissierellia bacterium]
MPQYRIKRKDIPLEKKIFKQYSEDFEDNNVVFEGVLNEKYKNLNDDKIISLIDGGRRNKGYEITREGLNIKGEIYNYSVYEIRKEIEDSFLTKASECNKANKNVN